MEEAKVVYVRLEIENKAEIEAWIDGLCDKLENKIVAAKKEPQSFVDIEDMTFTVPPINGEGMKTAEEGTGVEAVAKPIKVKSEIENKEEVEKKDHSQRNQIGVSFADKSEGKKYVPKISKDEMPSHTFDYK